jgi:pantothenate kinase type III
VNETLKELTQWSLAAILVGAGVAYSIIGLMKGHPSSDIPAWLSTAIGAAIGYYFGQRTQASTMSGISNGVTGMIRQLAERQQAQTSQQAPGSSDPEGKP